MPFIIIGMIVGFVQIVDYKKETEKSATTFSEPMSKFAKNSKLYAIVSAIYAIISLLIYMIQL